MFKKLFTILLAAVMMMSMATVTLAAKEETEPVKGENIYKLWGDFENEEYWEGITTGKVSYRNAGGKGLDSIADIGANGSKHSLKVDHTGPDKSFWIQYSAYPGETYDLSMMIKTDTPEMYKIRVSTAYDADRYIGTYMVGKEMEITQADGWVKYGYTFTVPKKHNGKNINNATYLNFDIDEGYTNYVIYIDDLSLVPHNYLPDADYSIINAGMVDPEGGDGVEVITPAETVDVQFEDVDNHWAGETIKQLAKYSYVDGMSKEIFAPDNTLTRAQFIKMVADLYEEEVPYDGRFSDVSESSWYAEPIMRADKLGIIPEEMKADGKILPEAPITREEAAAIAAYVAKERGGKTGKAKKFTDANKISEWAYDAVIDASSMGMINGYGDGTYNPKGNLTRAEASTILMRIIEVSERMNIYVDAKRGNDRNNGTESAPLASIEAARDMAKKYAPNMRNDIYIKIRGEQYLEKTFKLDESHSGQNGYKIIYTSWGEEQANITMAKKYTGFKLHDRTKNIWKVDIGKGTYSRQAYFNDVPGIRARTVGYMKNGKYVYQSHYECDNRELLDIEYPTELEFVYHIYWFNIYHQVGKISEMDNGKIRVDMHPQYFYTGYNRVNYYDGAKSARRQTPSYMENAYQFLDQQGEFYVDKHEGYLYYIPRAGEDMKKMEAKLPLGEEMIRAEGKDFNTPITHIAFDNLILEGATWLRTEQYGGADFVQNNELNDYAEEVPDLTDRWCIYFEACRYIDITNCNVRHIGCPGGALMFYRGAKHINIIGNEISQVSGVGLCVDYMMASTPYNRALNDRCEYVAIENNYIHDVAMDYEGGAAITLGHLRHSRANYNEISNVPYSGFHVGWGWEGLNTTGSIMYDLEINYNYIHDVMKSRMNDGGAIYTLGKSSLECDQTPDAPNEGANKNRVIGNYMANGWNCDYMYHDNSSSSWFVKNNVGDDGPVTLRETEFNFDRTPWGPERRYWSHMYHKEIRWQTHMNNYATADYAYIHGYMNMKESNIEPVTIVTDGNWPEEARKIMAEAGIRDEYKDKFNLSGPRIFSSIDRWQSLEVGVPQDSGIKILGDFNTEYPISDFDIQWWIDDPTAVTLDKNGMLTAHKPGLYEAEAFLFLNGTWQSVHFLLECGNEPTRAYLNHEIFNVVQGASVAAQAYVDMAFSATVEVTNSEEAEVEFTSDNPEIATIELRDDGKYWMVTAHKEGSTTIRGKVTYMDKTFNFEVPFNTITRSNQEAVNLPFKEFDFTGNWQRTGSFGRDGGYLVTGSPNFYQTPMSGLVAFDVSITPGHGWPAFTFSGDRANVSYTSSDCYMVGFTKEYIEFQRFNQGNRTMIFGNSNGPISGYAVGNKDNAIYTYGERMSVVLGAIDVEGGTRIIVNVNGKNYIDYTDRTSKRLPSHGYWAIYNPATGGGGMNFFPYSGITK